MTTPTLDVRRLLPGPRVLGRDDERASARRATSDDGLVLHLNCCDLVPGCPAAFSGRTADEIVLLYAQHSCACMHRHEPVELDQLLSAITVQR